MKRWYIRTAAFLTALTIASTIPGRAVAATNIETYASESLQTMESSIEETEDVQETESVIESVQETGKLNETESIHQTESETETSSLAKTESYFETETVEETVEEESLQSGHQAEFVKVLKAVQNLSAVTTGSRCIQLKWNPVVGADGYIVYRQIGKGTFEVLADTSDIGYVDVDADENEYNFYRVYPYYMDEDVKVIGPSDKYVFAKGSYQKKLPAVTNLNATTSGKGRVSLTWDSVAGADGYFIYRQIGNTKFEYRYLVNKTNYTDLTASEEEYNYYRVYPYYMDGEKMVAGLSDRYVFAKGTLPKELTATENLKAYGVGKGQVYLTWDSVPGAEGYLIYRQIGNAKFEYRYIVNKTNYTDTTASTTEYNYYRVYPYYMNGAYRVVGPSNSYVYSKGVLPVELTAVKNLEAVGVKRGQVDLKWDPVPGAYGYLIYRQVGTDSSFEYRYMVTKTTYNDTSASQTEDNFYRVYPFYKQANRNIVGPSDTYVYAKGIFNSGWYWIDGYKRYLNEDGEIDNDVSRLVSGPYLIKVYKWSNYLIIFAKDENGNYTVPVKAMITSCGNGTPTGTYYSPMKFRWLTMVGGSKAQWCTQITGDYLFHSVPYRIADPTTLYTDLMYNWLGTTQSLGCIRLQAGDAKWIYDNCDLGTEIYITPWEDAGPIAKPAFTPIPSWHTWDPTDPNTRYLCEQYGCH